MFIGHLGVSLALKRTDKTLSLGLLSIAVQLPDMIYGVILLIPDTHAGYMRMREESHACTVHVQQILFIPSRK